MRLHEITEANQVKANEKKPKKQKPSKGHQSPHPYQGRLVGESTIEEAYGDNHEITLEDDVEVFCKDDTPIATLELPVVLFIKALVP